MSTTTLKEIRKVHPKYAMAARLDDIRTAESFDFDAPGTCSSAVLRACGLTPTKHPKRSGSEIKAELLAAGRQVTRLWSSKKMRQVPTLNQFIKDYPQGTYVLITLSNNEPHSMALVDGALTDTDLCGTGRRRINLAYQVD